MQLIDDTLHHASPRPILQEPLAPPQMRRVPWGKPSGVYHHITVDRGQDVSLKLLGGDHCRIRLNELTATLKAPISIGGCFDER